MAINQLQIPTPQINNAVDPSMWGTLGNLGNVYQKAQEQARLQSTLAALGTDPQANMRILLGSGVPSLAQLGLNLQEKGVEQAREDKRYAITDKRADEQLAIQRAAAQRAQETYEKADSDEAAAADLIKRFGQPATAPQAAPAAPPFPAPLPGAMPPQPAAPPPQAAPSAFSATPILPGGLQPGPAVAPTAAATPPVKAEGDDGELPGWVQSAQASPPDTSIVGRVASNLTSPSPAAAAGISRDDLAALYKNPLTRPIATAFLQKQFSPGEWKYENVDGRIIATNSLDPSKTKDVTPPTASGAPPATKDQRERDARFADAKARGYDDNTANYVAINGKLPKEDLTPTEMKAVTDAQKQAQSGEDVLDNLKRLKELSPKAWSGWGASTRASFANALLPSDYIPQGAVDTKEMSNLALQNVAGQAKAVFGARLAVAEVKLLNQIETTPEMSDPERQAVYTRIEKMIQRHVDAANSEAEGIKNKTYFKPGGAATSTAANASAPANRPPLGAIFGQ
jgi:hypothetical protein